MNSELELFREEIFGPVVIITKIEGESQALILANNTEFGLSSAIYIHDLIDINDITVNDEVHVVFTGKNGSGLGRFNGEWVIEEFTTDHWVGVAPGDAHFPF